MTPRKLTAAEQRERDELQRRFAEGTGLIVVNPAPVDWAEATKPETCQRCGRTRMEHYLSYHEFREPV